MSRRRIHHQEEESSLELLLDTMCNTFGGVMFIAISLFVIISAMTQLDEPETPPNVPEVTDVAALRTEIASVLALLENIRQELCFAEEQLKIRQDSPEQRQLREIALLENLLKEQQLLLRSEVTQMQTQTLAIQAQQQRLANQHASMKALEGQKVLVARDTAELARQLHELEQRPSSQMNIEFKILRESPQAPFFLILKGDRVWPVGPWQMPNAPDRPDAAVTVERGLDNGEEVVRCRVNSGQGISILNGDDLTAEFRMLLKKIPPSRVPKFFIPPGSANTAYRMREILKRESIQHGCSLAVDDQADFIYRYTRSVRYEY